MRLVLLQGAFLGGQRAMGLLPSMSVPGWILLFVMPWLKPTLVCCCSQSPSHRENSKPGACWSVAGSCLVVQHMQCCAWDADIMAKYTWVLQKLQKLE